MEEAIIKITITGADKKLSESVTASVKDGKRYKYTHNKLLVSRLRMFKEDIKNLSEEEQIGVIRNVLIAERNIASFAADQYAELNQENIFNDLTEIIEELDELLKQ